MDPFEIIFLYQSAFFSLFMITWDILMGTLGIIGILPDCGAYPNAEVSGASSN
jgi:hypothetical protein